jgi:hypothetical protein
VASVRSGGETAAGRRLFAHMKQYGALDTVTVRCQERVARHVDLHMTAQLVLVLTRGHPRAR